MSLVTIVDYGMGNLRSVAKAIEKVGHQANVTSDPNQIAAAEKLILPGVGAFRDAIARLKEDGLVPVIHEYVESGRSFLGICLGLQLLFERSFEDGEYEGLGILKGDVVRFDPHPVADSPPLKVPHMGWNQLIVEKAGNPILRGIPENASVYFVHSYYVRPTDRSVIATQTDYGQRFTSMIWRDRLFAAQFHPEKSQSVGLRMLKNFAEL